MLVAPVGKYRYVKVEETSLLKGTEEDFIHNIYVTKYKKIKGISTPSEYCLSIHVELAVEESLKKNVVDLKLLNDEGRNALTWSIYWFRCSDVDNKTWIISDELKKKLQDKFKEYSKDIPLTARMYIVQGHERDTVLVAISMEQSISQGMYSVRPQV
jgi:hypothetical protein